MSVTLKRNARGALIRNTVTGALCTTCCVDMTFGYIVFGGLVIPMSGPGHDGVDIKHTLWYGYYWTLWGAWSGPYGDDQWLFQIWLSRSAGADYDGAWLNDSYRRLVPQVDGMPADPGPPIIYEFSGFTANLGGGPFEMKSGKLNINWDAGIATEAP